MKQVIKTVDGNRYEFQHRKDYAITTQFGEYYLRFETEGGTKFINCRHIVSITEVDESVTQ